MIYGQVCFIPLSLLMLYLKVDSVWLEIIIIAFSLFVGSFLYTQWHGVQVMGLKHIGSVMGTSLFQVTMKVTGYEYVNIVGEYLRISQYTDLALQSKLFKTLNTFPGNKWIKDFTTDENERELSIFINDHETPHPLNFTQVKLRKLNSKDFQDEIERDLKRLHAEESRT